MEKGTDNSVEPEAALKVPHAKWHRHFGGSQVRTCAGLGVLENPFGISSSLVKSGRGGWIRTNAWRDQNPLPYRLAT
ncbi:MAG TPA: hypothetical protein VF050_03350, partial [Moraxellaceae bacterium]